MITSWVLAFALAGAVALWAGSYLAVRLTTRPRTDEPAPASPTLHDEPPAVVNLLVNRWRPTEDAAEATLLDLAARDFFEIRQTGPEPRNTVLVLRPGTSDSGLAAFERTVLDRVRAVAVDGVVPLTALTFRDQGDAASWQARLLRQVTDEARHRGLSRNRVSPAHRSLLTITSVLAAVAVGANVLDGIRVHDRDSGLADAIWIGIIAAVFAGFGFLALTGQDMGQRDTPAGRRAAAAWLGLRAWLRATGSFHALPPASVAVWDRYLGYGAALGVTHTASEVIEFGLGSRTLVWSSYGGTWHRVRVRYPGRTSRVSGWVFGAAALALWATVVLIGLGRDWSREDWFGAGALAAGGTYYGFWLYRIATGVAGRYGRQPGWMLPSALFMTLAGGLVLRYSRVDGEQLASVNPLAGFDLSGWAPTVTAAGLLLGVGLVGFGCYRLVRAGVDLLTSREVTGQVLWREVWQTHSSGGEDAHTVIDSYHLAVDDGRTDVTTAWVLPAGSGGADPGDEVTIRIYPWTRRVRSVTRLSRAAGAVEPATPPPVTPVAPPQSMPERLLDAADVARVAGVEVTVEGGAAGLTRMATYRGPDRSTLLSLTMSSGTLARMTWAGARRATPVPGIPDAYRNGDIAAGIRRGSTVVMVTVHKPARAAVGANLDWLISRIATRLR